MALKTRGLRLWYRLIPLVVSAGLFLSQAFAMFSPLPLLLAGLADGFVWLILAVLVNGGLVYLAAGPAALQSYLFFVGTLALGMYWGLRRSRMSIGQIAAFAWAAVIAVIAGAIGVYALKNGVSWLAEARTYAYELVNSRFIGDPGRLPPELDVEEVRRSVVHAVPFMIALGALTHVWANLVLVLRLNPGRVLQKTGRDARAFSLWKLSDGWILLVLVALPSAVWGRAALQLVAGNVLGVLIGLYYIHGLAVASFCFDQWKIHGLFRTLAYLMAFSLMAPLVLAVGFFDHWFDFRAKFGQS